MGVEAEWRRVPPRSEKSEVDFDLPTTEREWAEFDIVKECSKRFEEDLRRILGDKYVENPKRTA